MGLFSRFVDHVQTQSRSGGFSRFILLQKRTLRSLQIVMYHGVSDLPTPFLPTTSVHTFRSHMRYLARHCHVLDLCEAVEQLKGGSLPERAVAVTLDDGYRDNYQYAFPILKDLGIPATIFLATGAIGNGNVLWHDQVCWMINVTKAKHVKSFAGMEEYDLRAASGRRLACERLLWQLRAMDDRVRKEEMKRLSDLLGVSPESLHSEHMLNWDEIKEMYQYGIRFGAHTVTHPILSRLPVTAVAEEVRESKRTIEEQIQDSVLSFAYPSGRTEDVTEEIRKMVAQEGFRCAVSTTAGVNSIGANRFDLKRVGYWDQEIATFGFRFECRRFSEA